MFPQLELAMARALGQDSSTPSMSNGKNSGPSDGHNLELNVCTHHNLFLISLTCPCADYNSQVYTGLGTSHIAQAQENDTVNAVTMLQNLFAAQSQVHNFHVKYCNDN